MKFISRRSCRLLIIWIIIFAYLYSATIRSTNPVQLWRQLDNSNESPSTNDDDDDVDELHMNYEIATTNYGWTTPQKHDHSRRILMGEFFRAVLAHPRYNASAWADLDQQTPDRMTNDNNNNNNNTANRRRIIAFMDVDTCVETNYPIYGASNWKVNIESDYPHNHRLIYNVQQEACQHLKRAVQSPAISSNADSRLVVLDCSPNRQWSIAKMCKSDPAVFGNDQVVVAYYSANGGDLRPRFDVGLPPPAIKPVNLTEGERGGIQSCKASEERKYLFSFQGRSVAAMGYTGREKLLAFQNESDFHVQVFDSNAAYTGQQQQQENKKNNYQEILKDSIFAGAPRGDNLFSYRFSEILSAGAVPVVYADGWLPPFNDNHHHAGNNLNNRSNIKEAVVNWTECAVFIPEAEYDRTAEILRDITLAERCRMQQCALRFWDRFASSRAGWVRALVAVALSTASTDR